MIVINKKGFTLIELLVALGLTGIIILLISSFLLTNIKAFNRTDDSIELQYHGQVALNYMIEKILPSKEIVEILDKTGISRLNDGTNSVDISKIIFKTTDTNGEIFEVKSNSKLFNGQGLSGYATTEIADYISNINIENISGSEDFGTARAIKITITLEKDGMQLKVDNSVYLRNYKD